MKNCVKFLGLFIFAFVILFFGSDNVKARTTCDYGIICKYSLPNLKVPVGGGYQMGGGYLYTYYQCSDSSKSFKDCSSLISVGLATMQDMSGNAFFENGYNPGETISFDNYDEIFHNTDSYRNLLSENDKFACPTIYYTHSTRLTGLAQNETFVRVGYSKFDTAAAAEEPLAGPVCLEQGAKVDYDELEGDAIEDSSHAYENTVITGKDEQKDPDNDSISNILDITNYDNYDLESVGDPCTIISDGLKNMLSSAFWFICVAGIVLVVVMTAISFIKAIVGSDDEKLKDAFKHLKNRIIVIIILLLLPMLLTFIINLINNVAGEGKVVIGGNNDIYCDVTGGGSTSSSSAVIDGDTDGNEAIK